MDHDETVEVFGVDVRQRQEVAQDMAIWRDERRRRRERVDNTLFVIACALVAVLFSFAWWLLP